MNSQKTTLLQEKNELEEKLRYLNMGIEALQTQRIAERVGEIPNRETLQETLLQLEAQEREIQKKIVDKKTETRLMKEEVNSIETKYMGLNEEHRKDNWSWLMDPMTEGNRQIAANEAYIGTMEQENMSHYQAKALTRNEIDAYKNKCHLMSEEEDPRIRAVFKEKEEIEGLLDKVEEQIRSL